MKTLRPYQSHAIKECWDALKKDDKPVLLMASVGAGKSLMLSSILLSIQRAGKRALCLVNNAELVRNNCATFIDEGGKASIYCAALSSKDITNPVIFGTPQSVLNGINKNEAIATIKFNIILVDEAHTINFLHSDTTFMRILRFYKQEYPLMRVLGATGTNFRFNGIPIVGDDALFKTQVGNITTEWLIEKKYLIKPNFEVNKELLLDFSKVKIKNNGLFDQKQLEEIVKNNTRLTKLICHQVVHIMKTQKRRGVFFFATTKKHAFEILSHLPMGESAIILGETPQHERTQILDDARSGKIRYLVNIAIISVGVDIPAFDTIAYLRPTESLVLLVQTMGRVLRLSPNTKKSEALVLDFAGNIERHKDWDNPILLDALKKTINKDKPLIFRCPTCTTMNTEHTRRCVGIKENKRCDWFFEWKDCPGCEKQVDLTSRYCPYCQYELIDPNAKLNLISAPTIELMVKQSKFWIQESGKYTQLKASYLLDNNKYAYESFVPTASKKAKDIFYANFIKQHLDDSSFWYPHLQKTNYLRSMLPYIKSPTHLILKQKKNSWVIQKKIFQAPNTLQ